MKYKYPKATFYLNSFGACFLEFGVLVMLNPDINFSFIEEPAGQPA